MTDIRAICFDLDDTLWDLKPVIPRAERALYDWFMRHYPEVGTHFPEDSIPALRLRMAASYPELRHDMTELRMRTLRKILADSGYDEGAAGEAFDVFQRVRNDVTLYDDVLPVLERLAGRFRLIALTNGNACLETIGIHTHFEKVYTARELGVAKPEAGFFLRVLEAEGLEAREALHVGDHPEHDMLGAHTAGMPTVWINREGRVWDRQDFRPDHELPNLRALPDLVS